MKCRMRYGIHPHDSPSGCVDGYRPRSSNRRRSPAAACRLPHRETSPSSRPSNSPRWRQLGRNPNHRSRRPSGCHGYARQSVTSCSCIAAMRPWRPRRLPRRLSPIPRCLSETTAAWRSRLQVRRRPPALSRGSRKAQSSHPYSSVRCRAVPYSLFVSSRYGAVFFLPVEDTSVRKC